MIPPELPADILQLPVTDNYNMVLVTGNGLRHQRFALRLQQAFGEKVVGWFALDGKQERRQSETTPSGQESKQFGRINPARRATQRNLVKRGARRLRSLTEGSRLSDYYHSLARAEKTLFQQEVDELGRCAVVDPTYIHPSTLHDPDFLIQLRALDPYFFLTLGGPLYKKALLESIRGIAINQHAGHSPLFKGSNTTEWALYHRNLACVSSTVHITTSGADAGPILRRSNPCLLPSDDIATVFLRVVALGTELMIESIEEIIKSKHVMIFPQPTHSGKTYLSKAFPDILEPILRDFDQNWLGKELTNQRNF